MTCVSKAWWSNRSTVWTCSRRAVTFCHDRNMTPALIWLIVAVALIAAEVLSGDFVLVMLGLGALFGAGSALITGNAVIDVLVFAVASTGLIWLARPALKRR